MCTSMCFHVLQVLTIRQRNARGTAGICQRGPADAGACAAGAQGCVMHRVQVIELFANPSPCSVTESYLKTSQQTGLKVSSKHL